MFSEKNLGQINSPKANSPEVFIVRSFYNLINHLITILITNYLKLCCRCTTNELVLCIYLVIQIDRKIEGVRDFRSIKVGNGFANGLNSKPSKVYN